MIMATLSVTRLIIIKCFSKQEFVCINVISHLFLEILYLLPGNRNSELGFG